MKVVNCYREKRTSKKTGNPYVVLCVEFENGYVVENFLTREQEFILANVPCIN